VGALSLVKKNLESWKLYAGVPATIINERNQKQILSFQELFEQNLINKIHEK